MLITNRMQLNQAIEKELPLLLMTADEKTVDYFVNYQAFSSYGIISTSNDDWLMCNIPNEVMKSPFMMVAFDDKDNICRGCLSTDSDDMNYDHSFTGDWRDELITFINYFSPYMKKAD